MAPEGVQLGPAPELARPAGGPPAPRAADDHRLFSAAIALSATRCLLSYVVLPLAAPLAGATASLAPAVGVPVSVLALVFDVRAIRRFWVAGHRWRWPMTLLYLGLIGLVAALLAGDVGRLLS